MKKFIPVILACGIALVSPTAAQAQFVAEIRAEDGTFLGNLNSDRFDQRSICNSYGEYGGRYGNGIFSTYGNYGKRSASSAYDPNNTKPPKLVMDGRIVGRVTTNTRLRNSVDPDWLRIQACERQ